MEQITETQVCDKKRVAIPLNPIEVEALFRSLNESPQNLLSIIAACTEFHEQAWHYNFDIFADEQKLTLTSVKKKHEILSSVAKCDFSDFMDEGELGRLERKLAKTKPSEVMY